ncbi:hypothetical protein [Nocardia sp. IFM 10818]
MKVSTSVRLDEDLLEHAKPVAAAENAGIATVLERLLRQDRMNRAVAHAAAVERELGQTSPEYYDELAAEYAAMDGSDTDR